MMTTARLLFPVFALAATALFAATNEALAVLPVDPTPVPEPGTLMLLIGGAVGVLVLRSKLRK
jgi:hypothetical protein